MKILKNKKFIGAMIILVVILIVGGVFLFLNNKEDKKVLKEETHVAYVKINPLVKLTYKDTYYECSDKNNKRSVCSDYTTEVTNAELINDDAKNIYKDLDLKGKSLIDALVELIDVANSNEINIDSVNITTDWEFFKDTIQKDLEEKTKTTIEINFQESINEEDLLSNEKDEEIEKKYTVTFDSNGGTKVEKQSITENESVEKPKNPSREGYTFVEWQLNNKKYDFKTKVTKDITLKAKWKKKETTDENTTSSLKINLNDKIEVYEIFNSTLCGGWYFVTNAEEVFPKGIEELTNYKIIPVGSLEIGPADWDEKFGELKFDSAKEKSAETKFKKIDTKNMLGIAKYDSSYKNHEFYYEYYALKVYDSKKYADLDKELNKVHEKLKNTLSSIFAKEGAYLKTGPCGGSNGEPIVLTEKLCDTYNLTCDRW